MLNVCSSNDVSVTLVGIHRESREKVVSSERAQKFADSLNLPYVEVDLNQQSEISELFHNLALAAVKRIQSREPVASMSTMTTTNLSRLVIKAESRIGCNCC
jgi:molybdopterin/thiamine biosynthesis adenylyltransferase